MAKGVPIQGRNPSGKAQIANVTAEGDLKVQLNGSIVDTEDNVLRVKQYGTIETHVKKPLKPQSGFIVPETISPGANIRCTSVDGQGALYGFRFKEVIKSTDEGVNWTTLWVASEPRFVNNVVYLANGALLVVLASNQDTGDLDGCIYLSDANQENFTKVLETPRGCVGLSYGIFTYDPYVLLSEYGPKQQGVDSPRRAYLSSDYGATWRQIFEIENHLNVHTHNIAMDTFTGRIWVTVGDQNPEKNAYYTDNWGETWQTLWASGECPINPLSIVCLPDCVLIGSDTPNELSFWRYDKRTEELTKIWRLSTPGTLQVTLSSALISSDIAVIPTHSDPVAADYSMLIFTDGIAFYPLWRQGDKASIKGRLMRIAGVHNDYLYLQTGSNDFLKFKIPQFA